MILKILGFELLLEHGRYYFAFALISTRHGAKEEFKAIESKCLLETNNNGLQTSFFKQCFSCLAGHPPSNHQMFSVPMCLGIILRFIQQDRSIPILTIPGHA